MAHTGTTSGLTIPNVGDAEPQATTRIVDWIDWAETNLSLLKEVTGTWTPEVWINGVEVGTYVTRAGSYSNIGTLWECRFRVDYSAGSAAVGVEIRGLPATVDAVDGAFAQETSQVVIEHPFAATVLAIGSHGTSSALLRTADGTRATFAGVAAAVIGGTVRFRA